MQNFFDIFGIDTKYEIQKSEIETKYFELLGKFHPDKASSNKESADFSQLSASINEGYKILLDDFKRAAHLLELNQININDDAKAPKLPPEILADIIEMQENLEANPEDRETIIASANLQKKKLVAQLNELFQAKDYRTAAIKAMHLKYLSLKVFL